MNDITQLMRSEQMRYNLAMSRTSPKYYSQYKGVWYKYTPVQGNPTCSGMWELSESRDEMIGYSANYNADLFRIDQCFDKFFSND